MCWYTFCASFCIFVFLTSFPLGTSTLPPPHVLPPPYPPPAGATAPSFPLTARTATDRRPRLEAVEGEGSGDLAPWTWRGPPEGSCLQESRWDHHKHNKYRDVHIVRVNLVSICIYLPYLVEGIGYERYDIVMNSTSST